jgi:hypothetical protein
VTVTVPAIPRPWIAQWYGYVPESANVKRNTAPVTRVPESNAPVSEVAVCETGSLFSQQTVLPGGISTVAGW